MKKNHTILMLITATLALIAYTQITIFVIQPLGMLPEGKTLVIARLNKTQFIDSPDGVCEREQGEVNLICRMGVLAGVVKNSTIILRLPYSKWLYNVSTGGKSYDR